MAVIDADMEMLPGPTSNNGKPKLLIGGQRRRVLKKSIATLQTLLKMDEREGKRATRVGYTPLFATGHPSSEDNTDVLNVIARMTENLLMKG